MAGTSPAMTPERSGEAFFTSRRHRRLVLFCRARLHAFEGGDVVACEPKEARSSNQAFRLAESSATTEVHCGAIAFSRTATLLLGTSPMR
jgi:hypothetical protein